MKKLDKQVEEMSYTEAMRLLDQRREGYDMPEHLILRALELTGDYEIEPGFLRLYEEA